MLTAYDEDIPVHAMHGYGEVVV